MLQYTMVVRIKADQKADPKARNYSGQDSGNPVCLPSATIHGLRREPSYYLWLHQCIQIKKTGGWHSVAWHGSSSSSNKRSSRQRFGPLRLRSEAYSSLMLNGDHTKEATRGLSEHISLKAGPYKHTSIDCQRRRLLPIRFDTVSLLVYQVSTEI